MERTRPLEPAFADAGALVRRHPGYPQLQALQEQIAALRRASGAVIPAAQAPGPTVFEPFAIQAPPAAPDGSHPPSQRRVQAAVEAELRLVERQLRREAEPGLAKEADRLDAAASEVIAAEQKRLGDALAQRRREIELRYRGPESQLVLRLQALERRLKESPLPLGEGPQLELQRQAAESDLQALRQRKAAEIEPAQVATQQALASFAAARMKRAADDLAAARSRSDQEIAQALQRQREALLQEASITFPPLRTLESAGALPFRPVAARPSPAARLKVAAEIARLEQLRAQVAAIVSDETRAAGLLVGKRHGLAIAFARQAGRPARDVTPQLARWLDEYWRAAAVGHPSAASQDRRRAGAEA